jgi:predicted metal-dependent hydrolase
MDRVLSYQVIRSEKRRRTISLRIKEDGKIVIYVPYRTMQEEIERFIEKSRSWVSQKLLERERSIRETKRGFAPGERFFYLGESYPLSIESNGNKGPPLKLSFGKFILDKNRVDEARDLFTLWYRAEAKETLKERVDYYSHRLLLFPKAVRITSARSRWGSCSGDNRLSFSWRIMMASLDVIDYILIHELAHIKEKNHSKRFWNYLESIIPDYKERRIWLKENGYSLCL